MGVEAEMEMRSVFAAARVGSAPHIYVRPRVGPYLSPFLTGKKKRIGVSSARLNPATRGAARRGGGGVREGFFSSQAPIA